MAINTQALYDLKVEKFEVVDSDRFEIFFLEALNNVLGDLYVKAHSTITSEITTVDDDIDLNIGYRSALHTGIDFYLQSNEEFTVKDIPSLNFAYERAIRTANLAHTQETPNYIRFGE